MQFQIELKLRAKYAVIEIDCLRKVTSKLKKIIANIKDKLKKFQLSNDVSLLSVQLE